RRGDRKFRLPLGVCLRARLLGLQVVALLSAFAKVTGLSFQFRFGVLRAASLALDFGRQFFDRLFMFFQAFSELFGFFDGLFAGILFFAFSCAFHNHRHRRLTTSFSPEAGLGRRRRVRNLWTSGCALFRRYDSLPREKTIAGACNELPLRNMPSCGAEELSCDYSKNEPRYEPYGRQRRHRRYGGNFRRD